MRTSRRPLALQSVLKPRLQDLRDQKHREIFAGAWVNALRVNKITQESPNVMDLILGHKIDLVIDTPTQAMETRRATAF